NIHDPCLPISLHSPIINDKNVSVNDTAFKIAQIIFCPDDPLSPRRKYIKKNRYRFEYERLSLGEQPFRSSFHYPYIRYIGKLDIVSLLKAIDDMKLLGELIIIMDPAD